jgi:hypothetical protein
MTADAWQARIVRFDPRRSRAIWIARYPAGGWLVLAGAHGWLHGSYDDARADADWLSDNFGFPVRAAAGSELLTW